MYDGTLSPTDQTELVAWATLFWQRMDQGGGSPGEGFAFTNPAMNSQLFNPLRAARPTLEKVGLMRSDDCDQMGVLGAGGVPEIASIWGAYRKAMLDGKIETDWSSDPSGTIEHVNLILAAPASAGLTVYVEGGKLVSQNLPLEKVDQTAYEATLKFGASQQTQDIIAALIASGAQWSTDAGTVTEAQKDITGQPSKADNFAATVQSLLDAVGVPNSNVRIVSAQFGVYGALPIIAAQLGDAMVLLDPLNGNLSGPFTPDSNLDATGLLMAHADAYVAGASVSYFDSQGCRTPALSAWWPFGLYPGTWTPVPAIPGALPRPMVPPWGGPPITINPGVPGWDSPGGCVMNPLGFTTCTVYRQMRDASGRVIFIMNYYICPAATVVPAVPPCSSGGTWVWF